jgi:molybdopterin converting factor small subunit
VRIAVHYMAQVKRAAGRAVEQVELERSCTVQELVVRLAERGTEPLRRLLLDEQGALQPALLLFVGDEQVSAGQTMSLREGDVVTVLSPMAGG